MKPKLSNPVKIAIFLALPHIAATQILCQSIQVNGYYINMTGDTIKGTFSEYRNWEFNPGQVEFNAAANGGRLTLTPDNCRSFLIDGYDEYISYTGSRLTNPIEFSASVNVPDSTNNYADIKTFLRVLYSFGDYYLLEFRDKIRVNYFIRSNNRPVPELFYKKYNDTTGNIREVTLFRNQLQGLFFDKLTDNIKLVHSLEALEYKEDEILSFFKKVAGAPKEINKHKIQNQFFVSAGVAASFFKAGGAAEVSGIVAIGADYSVSLSPVIGAGFVFYNQRNFGKLFLSPQLKLYYFKNAGSVQKNAKTITTTFQSIVPGVYLYIGYNLVNNPALSWYTSFGGGLLFLTNNKQVREKEGDPEQDEVDNNSSFGFGLTPQTGITIKRKIDVFAAYTLPVQVTNYISYSGKHSGFQLGVNFRFNM